MVINRVGVLGSGLHTPPNFSGSTLPPGKVEYIQQVKYVKQVEYIKQVEYVKQVEHIKQAEYIKQVKYIIITILGT